jgi:hypothetical protein
MFRILTCRIGRDAGDVEAFSKLCLTPDLSGVAAVPLSSAVVSRSRTPTPAGGTLGTRHKIKTSIGVGTAKLRPRTTPSPHSTTWAALWTRQTCKLATVATAGKRDVIKEDLNAWRVEKPMRRVRTVLDLRRLYTDRTMWTDWRDALDNWKTTTESSKSNCRLRVRYPHPQVTSMA